ncbi:MAG: hypothetical protein K0S24_1666 [Sphingobacterium sp.]|jgi:hypothetical protein|nr:hypothetical protein [Sphingobacterium sp.]
MIFQSNLSKKYDIYHIICLQIININTFINLNKVKKQKQ